MTCPSAADAKCIEAVKNAVNIPIVADIHFDYKAALACADVGVDKIRINPGNIGDDDRVKAVVQACQQKNIPIRIGVNGGSWKSTSWQSTARPCPRHGGKRPVPCPPAGEVRFQQHRHLHQELQRAPHDGGLPPAERRDRLPPACGRDRGRYLPDGSAQERHGHRRDAAGGIGDTIRVSLAAEPEKEVEAGYNILRAVGFPVAGPEVITCPTCGRTQYPCTEIANEVEKRLQGYKKSIKVAVMGCVVNGPGEAREADIGIAGGKGEAVLFIHGQPIKKLTGDNILDQFMEEIYKI